MQVGGTLGSVSSALKLPSNKFFLQVWWYWSKFVSTDLKKNHVVGLDDGLSQTIATLFS